MSYPGGKEGAGVYQAIINQMPPHSTYVEAFLGGGAVLRHKAPARLTVGIDLDESVIAAARDASWSRGVQLVHSDASEWLTRHRFRRDDLVYCDPPYLADTRIKKQIYRWEMSVGDHEWLLRVLKRLPCMVMISGYPSELYDRALPDWRSIDYQGITRGGMRTERLWCNFPAPLMLHDCRYAGGDFRERDRIKRKAARWAKMFARCPAHERQVILTQLASTSASSPADEPRLELAP